MREVTKMEVNAVAQVLAAVYTKNPLQAAFIFDRIFLRATEHDLEPERQFEIVEEDCPPIYFMVKGIHQEYLSLTQKDKDELKMYAEQACVETFNKHGIKFLDYYCPYEPGKISFNAIVGRVKVETSPGSIKISVSNPLHTAEEKNNNMFFSSNPQKNSSADPQSNQKNAKLDTDKDKREAQINAYQEQFKKEVLTKYFGENGVVIARGGVSVGHRGEGDAFTFHYTAGILQGKTDLGELKSFYNINESKTISLHEIVEESQVLGL